MKPMFRHSTQQPGLFLYRLLRPLLAITLIAGLAGCAHEVAFQDAQYTIETRQYNSGVVAVIDQATLNNTVSVRSVMTGIANTWETQPGQMLKQVADIELPQMFKSYEFSSVPPKPPRGDRSIILEMTIPRYTFEDFRATASVRVVARAAGNAMLFDKTYTGQGESQGGKMFWGGAFGMKSAIRQSSLDAYKKIFADMRADLERTLRSTPG